MTSVLPENMSLEEIKEQLALYNRLYYQKRRHEKDFMETKKASAIRHYRRKVMDKMITNGEVEIPIETKTYETTPSEAVKATKPRKYKGETYKIVNVE
jgi:ribosomal protein L15